ncbi:MAG: prepilin-type N-terminal cleavage/methylation domain-containing protein [Elusimicrobia bacterium]|nr:prepilin-type N-terminal cleavage/methylation domain-containing protein [Elusimicrobiota bacterium]
MKKPSSGFTLIELLVVVLIIGILAAIAVPQYFKVVEKGKFAECTQWINGLKGAQERYLAKNGSYFSGAVTGSSFDVNLGSMKYFLISATTPNATPAWTINLTRNTPTPAVYGAYVVRYTAPPGSLTCNVAACTNDLMP